MNTKENSWISVDKELPEGICSVLVFIDTKETYIPVQIMGFGNGRFNGHFANSVTHWMPLPQSPITNN